MNFEEKIYKIAKNENQVYECTTFEDGNIIILNALFEADEKDCFELLKKLCIKIISEVKGLRGFEINPYFNEATFYIMTNGYEEEL